MLTFLSPNRMHSSSQPRLAQDVSLLTGDTAPSLFRQMIDRVGGGDRMEGAVRDPRMRIG